MVIVGGGIIGLLSAWRLAQNCVRVAVVERAATGREASWAAAGLLDPGNLTRRDPLARLRRISGAQYPQLVTELQDLTGIDVQYSRCGALDLLTDDAQETAAAREIREVADRDPSTPASEPEIELLSVEAVGRLEPLLTQEIRGALLRRSVAQVRNPRLLAALRRACELSGVTLFENTDVTEISTEPGPPAGGDVRVTGVRTSRGAVAAPCVVMAAGAWSSRIPASRCGRPGPDLNEMLPVYPVRGQIVLYRCTPPPLRHAIECGRRYIVCRSDGHVLVGSTREHNAGYDKSNTPAAVAALREFAARTLPVLAQAEVVTTWAGLRPGSPAGRPYFGPVPGFRGLLAATGHYMGGLILAPMTARMVVEHVTNRPSDFDWSTFAPEWSPSEPLPA